MALVCKSSCFSLYLEAHVKTPRFFRHLYLSIPLLTHAYVLNILGGVVGRVNIFKGRYI